MRKKLNLSKSFALIGAAGYIAPKHMKAIKESGNVMAAAMDPCDSVGIIDSFFPEARFFTEIERFDRHLEKLRRQENAVEYMSICSPNYLHDAHIRLALRTGAHAICEKPLVINPWNLDALEQLQEEYQTNVYTILQLRLLPSIVKLRKALQGGVERQREQIQLRYVTRRGRWYHESWKGIEAKSGGLALNIGIHFFDLLIWLYGAPQEVVVTKRTPECITGRLVLEWADVDWFLSIDAKDLPEKTLKEGGYAYRSLTRNGEEIELSGGVTELHTSSYERILSGSGFSIRDVRASVEMVHKIRHVAISK